jgi:ATP-dependent Clp protease adaptor protein ClpS
MTERKPSNPTTDGHELAVEEAAPKLKRPSLYRVILINDDYTPMEFVVEILESVFGMERNKSTPKAKAFAVCSPMRSRKPRSRR